MCLLVDTIAAEGKGDDGDGGESGLVVIGEHSSGSWITTNQTYTCTSDSMMTIEGGVNLALLLIDETYFEVISPLDRAPYHFYNSVLPPPGSVFQTVNSIGGNAVLKFVSKHEVRMDSSV